MLRPQCRWIHWPDGCVSVDYNGICVASIDVDGVHRLYWGGHHHVARAGSVAQAMRWVERWINARDTLPGKRRKLEWGERPRPDWLRGTGRGVDGGVAGGLFSEAPEADLRHP